VVVVVVAHQPVVARFGRTELASYIDLLAELE
jgi:hypothetical protein